MQCNVAWGENQINDKGTYARNNAMACAARRRVAPCSHNALYQRTTSTKSIVSCARVLVHITHRQKKKHQPTNCIFYAHIFRGRNHFASVHI